MIYNRVNIITLNKAKLHIVKNSITKFIFVLKSLNLFLYINQNRAKPIYSLFRVFKIIKAYINIPNTKTHIQKKLNLKSGYAIFKIFLVLISYKLNTQTHPYKPLLYKVKPYQHNLLY